jgi:acyl carrier protein
MTRDEIKKIILEEIDNVAPGSVPDGLDPDADIREAMDLDSMDMLNLVAALHGRLGVDIPEVDVPRLQTLSGAIGYLEGQVSRR